MATRSRLSRAEQQEQTRGRLLDAAERLFASRGITSASIEEIAEEAGYSRGAFYSNFGDKHALVVALLERTSARGDVEFEEMAAVHTSTIELLEALRVRDQDESRHTLSLEYILYATRNPEARPEVARILRTSRLAIARVLERHWATNDIDAPVDPEFGAKVLEALDDGIDLHRLIEPDEFHLGTFVDVVTLLNEALVALSDRRSGRT